MSANQVQIARAILLLDQIAEHLSSPILQLTGGQTAQFAREATAMARMLRHQTEDIEALIRGCAAKGMGKQEAQETLGLSRYRFSLLVSVMPDIVWVGANKTSGRQRHYERIRGVPRGTASTNSAVQASVEARRVHEICGVRGSVVELYKLWNAYCSVGYTTVKRRLADGDHIYDAFFGPRRASAVDMPMTRERKRAFRGNA